ncbi:MAG: multicopper oxidase domain-containing protein, partial [Ilumatobacteraceae bacterium]
MSRDDRSILMWGSFGVAVAALFVAIAALTGFVDAESSGSSDGTGATVVDVQLSEFAITPAAIVVPPGKVQLRVVNNGTMVHNLSIPALGKKTADLLGGESEILDLGELEEGAYDALCEIAGHAASGMVATLTVTTNAGAAAPSKDGLHGFANWQEMDRAMEIRAKAFPAKTMGEKGGQPLEPEIAADGAKVFRLTAKEVDWEVEPGKIVKAKTYNGVVPGPEIRVQVGDRVRIVLTNELNESTSIHFHGIRVPNEFDGVDPYTQKPVAPGATFTYEFPILEPAVGIYHPHHDA